MKENKTKKRHFYLRGPEQGSEDKDGKAVLLLRSLEKFDVEENGKDETAKEKRPDIAGEPLGELNRSKRRVDGNGCRLQPRRGSYADSLTLAFDTNHVSPDGVALPDHMFLEVHLERTFGNLGVAIGKDLGVDITDTVNLCLQLFGRLLLEGVCLKDNLVHVDLLGVVLRDLVVLFQDL